jgi:bifunctional non-homologous end joining protein LigD
LDVILDGVITLGRPAAWPRRLKATSASAVRRLAEANPAVLMVFDLLWLEGHPTTALTYAERRRLLAEVGQLGGGLQGVAWSVPSHHIGDGAALLATAGDQGLPGIVAKRLDGIYLPGQPSPDWRTVAAPS